MDIPELEQMLSNPAVETSETIQGVSGDIIVIGAGGKMGPTLAMMLKKAAPSKTVYAVSRFSDTLVRDRLKCAGIETIAADLLDASAFRDLPQAKNVYYLLGMKFGATGNEPMTWAVNTYIPALVAETYKESHIAALSTGNVYPFVNISSGGADENTPTDPVGEYAQSCLGRERIFQHFAQRNNTPTVLIRLNYANEPRYGIIVDITQKIMNNEPIDLSTGYVNLIWQADANNYIARSIKLASSPACALNVTGTETVSIDKLARKIGKILDKKPVFTSQPGDTALLSNAAKCFSQFGYPETSLDDMILQIIEWIKSGNETLGKETKFQVRNGKF